MHVILRHQTASPGHSNPVCGTVNFVARHYRVGSHDGDAIVSVMHEVATNSCTVVRRIEVNAVVRIAVDFAVLDRQAVAVGRGRSIDATPAPRH